MHGLPEIVGQYPFTAPPELAALQSTIAQLQAEQQLLQSTVARYLDRIAELESGRGDPVAWLAEAVWPDGTAYRRTSSTTQITMRDLKYAWGEGVVSKYEIKIQPVFTARPVPVTPPPGEPVAYLRNEGIPNNLVVCDFDHPDAFKVFKAPPAPVAVPLDLRKRLNDVWLFLDGQAELNGCVWGEKPEGRHTYWWRKELRAVIEDVNACLDATAALNEVRE